jgi:alpha-L-fucosidase
VTRYEPTWESVGTHPLPEWYDDAKLGVFLHWGLYSVPGWAPQVPDIQELLHDHGPRTILRNSPYAEWYLNSMQIPGSPTQLHHAQVYGADTPYDAFRDPFDLESADADLDALAALCSGAGAGYVVLTTKHHDGFALWPSSVPHPRKGRYHARRDLVGDLTEAVRAAGMRMGLYYSGGYDWPYNDAVLANPADVILAVPSDDAFREYVTAHVRELIERYQPSVLWNDICWPAGGNLAELFADYYTAVPDGVVNDRWLQPNGPRNLVVDTVVRGLGDVVQAGWRLLPSGWKSLTFPSANHFDFHTPEYASFDSIRTKKWESTRGVGHSFGANRHERPQDIVTATGLIRGFCDIVAKNGNLLIGIGPNPDGTIPDEQQVPLRGLGEWMRVNGEAIRRSRPWLVPATRTSEDTEVRFTRTGQVTHVLLVDPPGRTTFHLREIDGADVTGVRLLGVDDPITHDTVDGQLQVTLPERLPVSAVHVLEVQGEPRPTGSLS